MTIAIEIAPDRINNGLPARRAYRLIAALIVAEMVAIFEGSMIYASMGAFYKLFGDPIQVAWIATAFLLAAGSTVLVMGRMADLYGRRRLALIALSLALIGSLVSGFAGGIIGIVIGRAIQGFSSAILPISYGLMREHLSREHAIIGIGVVATVMTVGAGVGIFLGGIIVDHLSWRWIFFLSAAMSVLGFIMIVLFVPASPARAKSQEKIDIVGAAMFACAICLVLFALGNVKAWGWSDGRVLGLFGGGVLLLAIWVKHQLHIPNPLADLRLLGARQPALANATMMLIGFGPLQAMAYVALLLQQPVWTGVGLGISATMSGLLLFLAQGMGLLGGPLASYLIKVRSGRFALGAGALFLVSGWGGIAIHHSELAFIVAMMMLASTGQAVAMAAVPFLILDAVPASRTSEATATITTLRPIAMSFGAQLSAWLVATSLVRNPAYGSGAYPDDGALTLVFYVVTAAAAMCLVCVAALPPKPAVQ